jgi:hypothetical protein
MTNFLEKLMFWRKTPKPEEPKGAPDTRPNAEEPISAPERWTDEEGARELDRQVTEEQQKKRTAERQRREQEKADEPPPPPDISPP